MLSSAQEPREQNIEVDDDNDSSYEDDSETTTTSLASSIYNFRKEHGRTYHAYKDGSYVFPNDERESDRLDLQHHMFDITFGGKLTYAPIPKSPKHVLDVGTGTGIWAMDFADMYPDCQVIGTDLSPTQPSFVPPNLRFIIDSAEDEWIYDQKFDLVHFRLMCGSFSNVEQVVKSAFANTASGGWIEFMDFVMPCESNDGTYEGTSFQYWVDTMILASEKLGRPLNMTKNYRSALEKAGYVDIQEKHFIWPLNPWPKDPKLKEIGRWNEVNISGGLDSFSYALLSRALNWSKEEIDVLIAKARADIKNRKIHSYYPMLVIYGRKP